MDTKVNDLVNLTLTLKLKIAFWDFVATGGIVFHKHTLICIPLYQLSRDILFIHIFMKLHLE